MLFSMEVIGCTKCLLLQDKYTILNYSPRLFCTKIQLRNFWQDLLFCSNSASSKSFSGIVILFSLHNAFIINTAMLIYARYAKCYNKTAFLANNRILTDTDCLFYYKRRSCKFFAGVNINYVCLPYNYNEIEIFHIELMPISLTFKQQSKTEFKSRWYFFCMSPACCPNYEKS